MNQRGIVAAEMDAVSAADRRQVDVVVHDEQRLVRAAQSGERRGDPAAQRVVLTLVAVLEDACATGERLLAALQEALLAGALGRDGTSLR